MSNDPNDRPAPPQSSPESAEAAQPEEASASADQAVQGDAAEGKSPRRRILIGSQRDPDAYRPKPKRDWTPISEKPGEAGTPQAEAAAAPPPQAPPEPVVAEPSVTAVAPEPPAPESVEAPPAVETPIAETVVVEPPAVQTTAASIAEIEADEQGASELAEAEQLVERMGPVPSGPTKFPLPSKRGQLSPDLEDEFQQALAGAELDDLMSADDQLTSQTMLEPESKHTGRVVAVMRDDVFVELGGREQGILPVRQFEEPPAVDTTLEVRVVRFNREEGLYELALPGAAADVGDWSDLEEGMLVDARVTGHNTGGLECEVNHIRGFIPVSQISLWRVEDLSEFVDQKFTCLVTEANPERRNLVLSRRAVLEREKEESRKQLLETLAPGQVREGVVRKLMDFGAFVDLGGVDGLLHVSQLSWARVSHPRDVLQEGQSIKVRVDKVDLTTGRISLAYRDMLESPWTNVAKKYPSNSTVQGKVSKLMDFGAFVELEPGVEGLVHISELAHKRVWRVSDVVKEGDEVEVVVLSVDENAQRISLSMKNALPPPEPEKGKESAEAEAASEPAQKIPPKKSNQPLKGGLGRSPLGEQFGLKW